MPARALLARIERLEQAMKAKTMYGPDCICFPPDEIPFFGLVTMEGMATRLECPIHGKREFSHLTSSFRSGVVPRAGAETTTTPKPPVSESMECYLSSGIVANRGGGNSGRENRPQAQGWDQPPLATELASCEYSHFDSCWVIQPPHRLVSRFFF
jgi:hypothetical protein